MSHEQDQLLGHLNQLRSAIFDFQNSVKNDFNQNIDGQLSHSETLQNLLSTNYRNFLHFQVIIVAKIIEDCRDLVIWAQSECGASRSSLRKRSVIEDRSATRSPSHFGLATNSGIFNEANGKKLPMMNELIQSEKSLLFRLNSLFEECRGELQIWSESTACDSSENIQKKLNKMELTLDNLEESVLAVLKNCSEILQASSGNFEKQRTLLKRKSLNLEASESAAKSLSKEEDEYAVPQLVIPQDASDLPVIGQENEQIDKFELSAKSSSLASSDSKQELSFTDTWH